MGCRKEHSLWSGQCCWKARLLLHSGDIIQCHTEAGRGCSLTQVGDICHLSIVGEPVIPEELV